MRAVDGTTLSPRERQVLAVLEAELRVDVELDLRLRTMRHHQFRAALGPACRALLTAGGALLDALRVLLAALHVLVTVLLVAARWPLTAPAPARGGSSGPDAPSTTFPAD